MLERQIQSRLVGIVRGAGGIALKQTMANGVPDYLFVLPNVTVFVEFKKDAKGQLTPVQQAYIKKLRSLNQNVEIVYDLDTMDNFIDKYMSGGVENGKNK